jgi:hypothetical protein
MPNQTRIRRAQPRTTTIPVMLTRDQIAAINELRRETGLSFDRQFSRLWRQQIALAGF